MPSSYSEQLLTSGIATAQKIFTDNAGNLYTTGYFVGSVEFVVGSGKAILNSAGNNDIFVTKADSNGNYLWAKQFGSTKNDIGSGITVDGLGNVYTTGYFQDTVDFDPGVGTANFTSIGRYNTFISKLDANGDYLWTKQFSGYTASNGIAVDSTGNLYTTGYFGGTLDFTIGTSTTSLAGGGLFACKLDGNGNYLWAKQLVGNGLRDYGLEYDSVDRPDGVIVDSDGNLYTSGSFSGTVDFDPGAGIASLTSAAQYR
jgi:hypothetical protein